MFAEWLATGWGMGYAIVAAVGSSQMSPVWSLAATITAVSILLYMSVAVLERGHRPAPDAASTLTPKSSFMLPIVRKCPCRDSNTF